MSEPLPDDARLRATEAQMRQALGLQGETSPRSVPDHATPSNNGPHPQRRRFVRDGEVPVTLVHRDHRQDDASGSNQLEAARQALRSQSAAKEHVERLLVEAQNAIRDLQTKLAHERLAKDEAIQAAQRAQTDGLAVQQTLQAVQEELAVERLVRQKNEEVLTGALEARGIAEQRLRDATARQTARKASKPLPNRIVAAEPGNAVDDAATRGDTDIQSGPTVRGTVKQARRRGRPTNVGDDQKSDVVEWWKPGWQKRFR
jgi:hypothetical protein